MTEVRKNYIAKMQDKLNGYNKIIKSNNGQITNIQNRLSTYIPENRSRFRQSIKFTRSLIRLVNMNIELLARTTTYLFAIKRAQLSTSKNINVLTSTQLFKYIEYIEETSKNELFPNDLNAVNKIKAATRHLYSLMLKRTYLVNVALPKSRGPRRAFTKVRIKQINKNIEYYNARIKDLKASFASKYIARMISKLEKSSRGFKTKHAGDNKYLINLENVVKYYNNGTLAVKVLSNVNLKIKPGEFVVILGPSGSGKTTLLNIISGMDTATYGQTIVANRNLIKYNSSQLTQFRRDNVGYIFQQYGLLPNLTVHENVEIGSNLQKDEKKRIDINELLKSIGIYEQRNKFPRELSGGQQQRVSIARSMAKNPRLLFGDEPTGAIDTEMSKQIMQLFVDINKRYKTTVIIVTHNPIIANLATMVVRVENGRIDRIIRNDRPKSVNQIN
jgi:putative ABC transport system ATP-binding protein